jgi:hypothetical protein
MAQYGTWVSYSGTARIWLAIGLLAATASVVYAGIRLPLPARIARPGKAAAVVIVVAWAAAILAFLVCVKLYVQHYVAYLHRIGVSTAVPFDRILPVTLTAVAVVFFTILIRGPGDSGMRLARAAIGAITAPFIFEFPFDFFVMTRTYPPIPPDPAMYRALFFVPWLLVDATTLLLLWLVPAVRLTRATFFSFALMLAVFAVWALTGFGYPGTPVPITLNVVSKLLAFTTALTLFFPRQFAVREPVTGRESTSPTGITGPPAQ